MYFAGGALSARNEREEDPRDGVREIEAPLVLVQDDLPQRPGTVRQRLILACGVGERRGARGQTVLRTSL